MSKISWTEATWNPWRGCTRVSPGCENCYMFAGQLRGGFDPETVTRTKPEVWKRPYRWQKQAELRGNSTLVFTCSWSDWFHPSADPWRGEAWRIIKETPLCMYQILTKRPRRMSGHLPADWGDGWGNVWLGVSIESQAYAWRANYLREVPAAVRFVSYEPALGPLELDLAGIDWVIYGGESGPGYRVHDVLWARSMRDRCKAAGVSFWFKQGNGLHSEMNVELDGAIVREFPPIERPAPPRRVEQLGFW